ncbi:MAG: hypothetical protein ACYCW6_27530, partial [Candidatus Xenobia bacterium]
MRRILFALLLLVASGLLPAAAQSPGYGLLVVGDASNPSVVKVEKAIKARVQRDLSRASVQSDKLPLMSYHLDNAKERQYCEGKLGIKANEVPLVAVVEQSHY